MRVRSNTSTIGRNTERDLREELGRLVALAASDELDDETLAAIRQRAIAVTDHLAGRGLLPAHLIVEPHDPVIVVARTLAAARRRLPNAPAARRAD